MPAARRLATVVTLAVVTLVGGCSDEPEPRFAEPTPSESGSPASPTEAATQREIVESFFTAVSTSISTGDPEPWLSMTTGDCSNCETLAENLRSAYTDGGSIEGGGWTLLEAEYLRSDQDGNVWSATVKTQQEQWVDAEGNEVKTVRPENFNFEVALRQTDDGLAIGGIRTRAA